MAVANMGYQALCLYIDNTLRLPEYRHSGQG